MITTNPTAREVDATLNLLSVLALAKDADLLADRLEQFKSAMADADAKLADVAAAQAAAADLQAQADQSLADAQAVREQADAELLKAYKATEDASNDRSYCRTQREAFDQWAAQEREKLVALGASTAAREDALLRDRLALEDERRALQAEKERVGAAQDAAIAFKAEYEAKLDALKQVVS